MFGPISRQILELACVAVEVLHGQFPYAFCIMYTYVRLTHNRNITPVRLHFSSPKLGMILAFRGKLVFLTYT